MPVYLYKAKQGPDRIVEGELIAENRPVALSRLEAMGCIPVWLGEKGGEPAEGSSAPVGARYRVRSRDLNTFTRQLASLLRSGVPVLRALRTIGAQTGNRRMRRVVSDLETQIQNGGMLSESMHRHPRVFQDLYVNMVRSGEAAGVVDEILLRLADAQDEEDAMRTKIEAALAYPLLVLAMGVASALVMVTVFLPRLETLYRGIGQALPLPTRILLGISRFSAASWHWWLLALVGAVAFWIRLVRTPKGRTWRDQFALRLPVAGRLLRDADLARFGRTLALLIQTGIPVHRAIELTAGTLRNSILREEIGRVSEGTVQQGASLATGLRQAGHVPAFVTNMVAVGEESGRIEDALAEVARFYGRELDRGLKLMAALLEPLLLLAVGVIVGFIIFAMLLPVFQMGQSLR